MSSVISSTLEQPEYAMILSNSALRMDSMSRTPKLPIVGEAPVDGPPDEHGPALPMPSLETRPRPDRMPESKNTSTRSPRNFDELRQKLD